MKKYFKLLWIIPLIIAIIFSLKNVKFINSYTRYLVNNNKTLSFSIFTKSIANDAFFSIPLGERILEEGFKTDDILTWHEGLKFTNDRWLFNLIICLVYRLGGIEGIASFTTFSTLLIGIVLFLVMKDRTKNMPLSIFGSLFVMYFSRTVFQARAQILSFPLFILEFWSLERLVETGKRRYSIQAVLFIWLIANVHASVYPISLIMFLPYLAEWIFRKDFNIKIFIVTFFISLVSGIFTPTGFTPYTVLIRAFLYTDTSFIGECQPSNIHNNLPLFVILSISIILMFIEKNKIKIRDLFFILGFGIMGILVFRGTFFFHFISSISLLRIINQFIEEYNLGINDKRVKVVICASFVLILVSLYLKHFLFIQRDDFVPKDLYPVEATDYILKNVDYENMRIFNSFNFGSYLEFRGIKSFIDSRSEVYTDEFNPGCTVLEDWLEISEDASNFENIFEKYKITHALVKTNTDIYNKLEEDNNYNKIYTDDYFSLFEKGE